jgi:hypothetical protein
VLRHLFDGPKAQAGPRPCFCEGLGITPGIFVRLHSGVHVWRRQQLPLVPLRTPLPRPRLRPAPAASPTRTRGSFASNGRPAHQALPDKERASCLHTAEGQEALGESDASHAPRWLHGRPLLGLPGGV